MQNRANSLDSMPVEILENILSQLLPEDLMGMKAAWMQSEKKEGKLSIYQKLLFAY